MTELLYNSKVGFSIGNSSYFSHFLDPLSMLPSLPIPSPLSLPALSDCQNIQLLYSRLEPETIISLFASILNERRVIVYSNSLTNLTAVVHGSNQLLYPLFWQHIYIPILPSGLTDYCCAPMPFLCGVPSSLMERVRNLPIEDVVLLDIDSSQVNNDKTALIGLCGLR